MSTVNAFEAILRHAYINVYSSRQWAEPTRECLQKADTDLSNELCDLLLSQFFTQTQVSEPLLERYLAFAVTGHDEPPRVNAWFSRDITKGQSLLIQPKVFLSSLVRFVDATAIKNPYQWSHILKCLPSVLSSIDSDRIISEMLTRNAQQQSKSYERTEWPRILCDVFIMLSRIVAVGLYREYYCASKDIKQEDTQASAIPTGVSSQVMGGNTQPGDSLPFNFTMSQRSAFDPDATIELDSFATENHSQSGGLGNIADTHSINDSSQATVADSNHIETMNAIMAAHIMVDLIEKKGAKRIFEVMKSQQKRSGTYTPDNSEEPWATCQAILAPPTPAAKSSSATSEILQNPHIQKLLVLVNRLTDRELDRRMAVHLKYQELEDEGTARALPSAGLMAFLYHLVQIRPTLNDEYILDYLTKLQSIKGSFDESFYLEIWFTALTGLREASVSAQRPGPAATALDNRNGHGTAHGTKSDGDHIMTISRMLWRNLVLVKIPDLILKLQQRRRGSLQESGLQPQFGLDKNPSSVDMEFNPLESSLMELKSFSGLLNGCGPQPCVSDLFISSSIPSNLIEKITNGNSEDDDDDDIMKMINDMNNTVDLNTPDVTKAILAISNESIFTSIVRVCESYGFVRKEIAEKLLDQPTATVKTESGQGVEDDFVMDSFLMDDLDTKPQSEKVDDIEIISQNIEQRTSLINESASRTAIKELLYIGLVSTIHTLKVIGYLIEFLNEKATRGEMYALANLCEVLVSCPGAIDVIGQLYHPLVLLAPLERVINHWSASDSDVDMDSHSGDGSQNGDDMDGIRTLYGKFGKVWSFVVLVLDKFNLYGSLESVFKDRTGLCYKIFTQGPCVYGRDIAIDDPMESFVREWLAALLGNSGLSDGSLRAWSPQILVLGAPTLIWRIILLHDRGLVETGRVLDIMTYFQEKFLSFSLLPGVIVLLCEALLGASASIALSCLHQLFMTGKPREELFMICGSFVLGSLKNAAELKRQELVVKYRTANLSRLGGKIAETAAQFDAQVQQLQKHIKDKLGIEERDEQTQHHTETVSTNVTSDNFFRKAQEMFRYIVKSGRSMFMRDVDADTVALWDPSKAPKQTITHYLDMVLFQVALDVGGPHWFVSMIVDEVLEAGKSGGAVRAAELGSCLLTTPLTYSDKSHTGCHSLLRCLLQDAIPCSLRKCSRQNASFFQGQTLGVFTSDCLVLMHGRGKTELERRFVDEFGRQFFETLVVDSEDAPQIIHGKECLKNEKVDRRLCGAFGEWPDYVVQSPVWRGFVKGLMSNPLVNEVWPNTFI